MKPGLLVFGISNNHPFMPDAFFWSYHRMFKPNGSFAVKGARSVKMSSINSCIAQAHASDYEWLFLMDVDMTFPQNTIPRLLDTAAKHNAKIVSVQYPLGRPPYGQVAGWINDGSDRNDYVNSKGQEWREDYAPLGDGVVEVDWVGSGGLLVHRNVIEAIQAVDGKAPFLDVMDEATGIRTLGHDMNFCKRAKALGYKILVDTAVKSGHGKFFYVDETWAEAFDKSKMEAFYQLALQKSALEADYWNMVWQTEGIKNLSRNGMYVETYSQIVDLVPEKAKVADIGCGPGALMELLRKEKDCDCTGYDFSEQAIQAVKAKGFGGKVADVRTYSANGDAGQFDVVVATHTLEHVKDDHKFVALLKQLCKRGGKVILATPSNETVQGHFEHVRGYTDDAMARFIGSHFKSFVVKRNERDYVVIGDVD